MLLFSNIEDQFKTLATLYKDMLVCSNFEWHIQQNQSFVYTEQSTKTFGYPLNQLYLWIGMRLQKEAD